jgi:hypothetical protein
MQIAKFHKNYEKRLLDRPSASLYKYVARTIHPKKSFISSVLNADKKMLTDPTEISHLFLEKFFDTQKLAPAPNRIDYSAVDPLFDTSLMFISDAAVFNKLADLPNSVSTTAPDHIPYILLKKCLSCLAYHTL